MLDVYYSEPCDYDDLDYVLNALRVAFEPDKEKVRDPLDVLKEQKERRDTHESSDLY